jgi:hypothetical protein
MVLGPLRRRRWHPDLRMKIEGITHHHTTESRVMEASPSKMPFTTVVHHEPVSLEAVARSMHSMRSMRSGTHLHAIHIQAICHTGAV